MRHNVRIGRAGHPDHPGGPQFPPFMRQPHAGQRPMVAEATDWYQDFVWAELQTDAGPVRVYVDGRVERPVGG